MRRNNVIVRSKSGRTDTVLCRHSRLDYTNALLYDTSAANIHRLYRLCRTHWVICQAPRSASATKLCQQLHWLPVHQRINYTNWQSSSTRPA